MFHRRYERFRYVGPSDSVPNREWKSFLRELDGSAPAAAVPQHARANDRVVQAALTNGVLCTPPPDERVALVEIEARRYERACRDPARRHVHEPASRPGPLRGYQRVQYAIVLGCLDSCLARRMAATTARSKDDVTRSLDGARQRLLFRYVSGNDLNARPEDRLGVPRVSNQGSNWQSALLEKPSDQEPSASCATDDQDRLVDHFKSAARRSASALFHRGLDVFQVLQDGLFRHALEQKSHWDRLQSCNDTLRLGFMRASQRNAVSAL